MSRAGQFFHYQLAWTISGASQEQPLAQIRVDFFPAARASTLGPKPPSMRDSLPDTPYLCCPSERINCNLALMELI